MYENPTANDRKVAKRAAIAIVFAMLAIALGPGLWGKWRNSVGRLGEGLVIYDHDGLLSNRTKSDLTSKLNGLTAPTDVIVTVALFKKKSSLEKLVGSSSVSKPHPRELRLILVRDEGEIRILEGDGVKPKAPLEVVGEASLALRSGDPDFALYKQLSVTIDELGLKDRVNIWEDRGS